MAFLYDYNGVKKINTVIVSPEMFGAVGDGVTDDTSAIQNAVNNGGLVVFASGKNTLLVGLFDLLLIQYWI